MGADAVAIPSAIGKRKYRRAKRIGGAYSRIALGDIDGRLREARLMREITDDLTAHCGGKPSAVQRQLIQRAAVLHLRLALMDDQEPDGHMTEKTAREYLCWNNAYCRTLRLLGLKGTPERSPGLAEILAAMPAREPQTPPDASPRPDASAAADGLYSVATVRAAGD